MNMKNYLIDNVDKITEEKLKELKLKPEMPLDSFIENDKRFYSTPCKTEDGKLIFIKILISKRKEDALRLKKEVKITKFLSKCAKASKDLNILPLIKVNTTKHPYWFLRQYVPGSMLGYDFEIYKEGLKEKTIRKVVDTLLALQSMPLNISLKEKGADDYLKTIKVFENKLQLKDREREIDFKEIYHFFENQRKYFKKENPVLAHGDLVLKNLFVNQNSIYLIDWELARIDNSAADIARLCIQPYKYSDWRKKLVLYFSSKLPRHRKENFNELFRVAIMVEAIAEFFCDILITPKESQIQKTMKQTIKAALKGFDFLLR